ncbi:MAG: hypothetical protein Q8N90_01610, partial [bacterium]|nr:hypothetical protein [bacterium]
GDIIHFFILDVEKYVFLDQSINIKEKIYLKQVFSEYQKEIELLKKKIKVIYPKATFSFIPGIIGSENVPQGKMFFVYSGLNYLYHEKDNKTYALFMKYPSSYIRKDINSEIKQTLKSRSIEPIEVSCRNEFYNFFCFVD